MLRIAIKENPNFSLSDIEIQRKGLSFSIDTPSELKLEVYDVSGKLVETVAKGFYQSGSHMIQWNASEHSSGMYFVYLVKGSEMRTQKVMLLK